jgi:poly(hydroxyalkanoate) granule-associated protein
MADQPKKKVTIVAKKKAPSTGTPNAATGAASGTGATDPTAAAAGRASAAAAGASEGGDRKKPSDRGGLLDLHRLLDFPAGVADQAREVWMAGIGALSTVEEAGQAIFDELVRKGERWEQDSRQKLVGAKQQAENAADRAKSAAQDLSRVPAGLAAGAEAQIQRVVEDTVEGVLHRLGVPTHEEVRELIRRVETLSGKVDSLMARLQEQAAEPVGPPPAAPADEREMVAGQKTQQASVPGEGTVYHVTPATDGWVVQREGTSRASSSHGTKAKALSAGRELARKHAPSTLVVYRQDGTIQDRVSYETE